MRKQQSDFGWDWSPAYSPTGIWQPVYAVQLQQGQIYVKNSMVDIYRNGQLNNEIPDQSQPWVINVVVDYLGSLPFGTSVNIKIVDSSGTLFYSGSLGGVTYLGGTLQGSVLLNKTPNLWWPVGYGSQTLYGLTAQIVASNKVLATVQKNIGFRTIVLNQFPITIQQQFQGIAGGNAWHFEINGHEFFAKGSNFVPASAFWTNVTPDSVKTLFQSVLAGVSQYLSRI